MKECAMPRKDAQSARFFTTEQLGKSRSLTPEGFLVIQGTPISRIGAMTYLPEELFGDEAEKSLRALGIPDSDELIVHRFPKDVFSPASLASFNAKPLVN